MKKRTKIGSVVLSLMLGVSVFATAAFGQAPEQAAQDSFRVLIKGNSNEKAKAQASYGKRHDFGAEGFTTNVNESQYKALLKNKNLKVELVEQVEIYAKPGAGTMAPTDQTPWGIEAIYNDSAITQTSGGDGIKVAVLDTGVNKAHTDLAANVEQCKDFTQRTSPLVNGVCNDKNGHGTHVAGTVLANGGNGTGIYGVAPQAELWAYKVLNDRGSGYSDDIAAAIEHAANEATRLGVKTVISMSLGSSTKNTLISNAVDYAYGKGALVVAAAGNSGPSANTIGYPGALVNAIAVASLDNTFVNGTHKVSDFSSRGNPNTDGDYVIQERDIELSAPGGAIYSTATSGGYTTMSGTSMATPHISGLAAKIWAENKSLSNVQIRTELQNRAKLYDIKGGTGAATGDDYASGFGFPRVR
ncbi:peptidase S8 [Bacillus sp. FJAT-27225]|uniref:S8 family peptidase n=1 Tax=Bacillus sp. FJAT-27225 TaxID=1743144 RepID=UPI00080C28DB|nr:S8 family peptidase [Bacillus sp. FJAT-27225]OCA87559.1 peptidase S8 [Bacillus sp. FJAT-27225]